MIPRRLQLSNFLSYRQTVTLDFAGVHLACISGENGAGKSSLLDSMTWALFGKSRSRSDDDIVNRLAARDDEQAQVQFDFDLEEQAYRVIRRKRPGRSAELEFQIHQGEDVWEALTEGRLRETQAEIEHLLGMNFDTFTNASFFLQGQADAFTTKTAGKRKEILADLLGVSRWDQYKEVVNARRRAEQTNLEVLDLRLQDLEAELAEEQARRDLLTAAQTEYEATAAKLADKEALLAGLRQVAEAISQQEATMRKLNQMGQRQEMTLARLRETFATRQKERDQHQALIEERELISTAHEAYLAADAALQGWQEKGEQFSRLQLERRPHELTLEGARNRLQEQEKALKNRALEVAAMQEEKDNVSVVKDAAAKNLAVLEAELKTLAVREEAWHEARAALQTLTGERNLLEKELAQLQEEKQRTGRLSGERHDVENNLAEAEKAVSAATARVAVLGEQGQRFAVAAADRDNRRAEQRGLREKMDQLKERVEKLKDETGGVCPLCGQPLTEEHRVEVLAEVQQEGEQLADKYRKNKQVVAGLETEIASLEKALQQSGRAEQELQIQQQRRATAQARLEEIDRQLATWETEGQTRVTALQAKLDDDVALRRQEELVAELTARVQDKGRLEKERQSVERDLASATARLAEIEKSVNTWQQAGIVELKIVQEKLAEKNFAPESQKALVQLDKAITEVGYDQKGHQAARAEHAQWTQAPARYQALQQAVAAIKPLDDNLTDLREQLNGQEEQLADIMGQKAEVEAQLVSLQENSGNVQVVEKEVFQLREERIAANRRVGAAQQRLSVLADVRAQLEAKQQERATLTRLIGRLERLEKACGRDGVQALLIEQALPEIETDANALLERLTGGAMRVVFDTQRKLKSRDALAETLDIRISDPAGERPYENYSGGEKFRVNFAIRLALSKILARRAGARLQTLVIDEGFGSQDPAGRQRLVEAINTIQDDFARILVITHIDELRDVFPTQIHVEKRPAGSQINILNQ
jgi:exonuclease SbcC